MIPQTRRDRLVILGVLLVLAGAAAVAQRQAIWRAAYPYLPRQVQAAPYRLMSMGETPVPVTMPTAEMPTERRSGIDHPGSQAAGDPTTVPPTPMPPESYPVVELPPAANLPATAQQYQTWNNCGPATISMALGTLGLAIDQAEAAKFLKPDPNDKNVSPQELAELARRRGLEAVVRADGRPPEVKALLAAGIPVVAEVWFVPEPGDEMGHYVLLTGYDDTQQEWLAQDSYRGPDLTFAYAEFDADWRAFNRVYVAAYPADRAGDVRRILGQRADDQVMWAGAAARASEEVASKGDVFAWFNLGTSLTALGDYEGAAAAFDEARALGLPWRMLWYQFEPFESYAAVGRWSDVEALARANLQNASNLEESHLWLGRALAAAGSVEAARRHWRTALELNPNLTRAAELLAETD